jgi:hypothetical protein
MPNDILSLKSFPPASQQGFRGGSRLRHCLPGILLAMAAASALPGCGEEDDSVTYDDDVRPLFADRCTTCHRPVSPIEVDIQNPFAPGVGLVASLNTWAVEYPGETPARNVEPFEPENSFLIDKLTGMLPANGHGGSAMPLQVEPLDEDQVDTLEAWVSNGAQNDATFASQVRPIFGDENDASSFFSGRCVFCHYEGTPNPPDLTNPFGPNGLVNVNARYRADMVRVKPGDPEESLLILKVRATSPDSDIGNQMPYSYNPLTATQLGIVRQWIAEGARP